MLRANAKRSEISDMIGLLKIGLRMRSRDETRVARIVRKQQKRRVQKKYMSLSAYATPHSLT